MYLATASPLPPKAMWNRTGRGYPDMAATGDNILCVWNGAVQHPPTPRSTHRKPCSLLATLLCGGTQVFPLGGTSASGPIAAGLVSLINDRLLSLGLPPVGHLNSLICASRLLVCCKLFAAAPAKPLVWFNPQTPGLVSRWTACLPSRTCTWARTTTATSRHPAPLTPPSAPTASPHSVAGTQSQAWVFPTSQPSWSLPSLCKVATPTTWR